MTNLNRNLFWVAALLLLGFVFWYFSDIVSYVLLAWVLSMIGQPLMVFFQNRVKIGKLRMGPSMAAGLTILTFFFVFGLVLVIFVPQIVAQGKHLTEIDYVALGQKLEGPLAQANDQLHQYGLLRGEETLGSKVQAMFQKYFSPNLVSDYVRGFIATTGNVVVTFTSTIFILFFFLKEKNLFTDMIHAFVPNEHEEKVVRAVDESSRMLTRYLGGLLIQAVCFFALVSFLLWLFGVENAMLIGSFGGLMNIIPYVGPILGFIFGVFITVSSGLDLDFYTQLLPLILKVGAAFAITQAIDNLLISTIIFAKTASAHPLEIFIVIMIGAKLGGVAGMVFAIPAYTVLRVVARTFFNNLKFVQALTESMNE